MTIANDSAVSIEYMLKDETGTILDNSDGEAMVYVHGYDMIIPGLERELSGKKAGDCISCVIKPQDAYGEYDDELVFSIDKDNFEDTAKLEPGMQFQSRTEAGWQVVTVVGVDGSKVKVDANHPLAGKSLHFDVTIMDVRKASEEELAHARGESSCGCGCENENCGCGDGCGCEDDDCGCGSCR